MLTWPFPIELDPEGEKVPRSLPFIVDAHVHLFPDPLFDAIWKWFEQFAWPIRYRLKAADVIDFLLSRGISHIVALHYAHRPGIARMLNAFMAELCSAHPQVTGTATVFPGEEGARAILEEAFQLGLHGVKLHSHVQCFRMDCEAMHEICDVCVDHGKPLVMHVGREPRNPYYKYRSDPYLICSSDKLEQLLVDYPKLNVCVPHLGANEFTAYKELVERYDNLWLDISMVIADYLPNCTPPRLAEMRADRIMYGTDFPHIPYAWDREIKCLCGLGLSEESMELILGRNAVEFFSIPIQR
ncbi:MAG: amidohydrolase family protein [Desulfomonilaceae bacterium]